jgi:hypothetical protein
MEQLELNYMNVIERNDFSTHIGELTEQVFDWAEATFPYRNDASMYLKIYGEVAEMIESDGASDEIADMFILLLDYAKRKKVDVTTAVLRKLDINRSRKWATNKNGVNSHVEPQ